MEASVRTPPHRLSCISKQVHTQACGVLCELRDTQSHCHISTGIQVNWQSGHRKKSLLISLTNAGSFWSQKFMALLHAAHTGRPITRLPGHSSLELTEASPNGCRGGGVGLDHSLSQPNTLALNSFPKAAITKYRELGGLTQQKCIPSQIWRPEVQIQGVSRAVLP